jgi:arylsulfatase A-like enzyme
MRHIAVRVFSLLLLGAVSLLCAASAQPGPGRPNVLLIISDDQGFGDFSSMGHPLLKTPHLDHLKGQSLWMRNFYASPLCAPTRAQLMTGRHQFRTGVWDTWASRSNLAADEQTLADHFKASGYRTGIFGKWHLGENFPFRPQDRGFEETLIWNNFDRMKPTFSRTGQTTEVFDRFVDDVNIDQAVRFMREGVEPFFLYLPLWMPHTHWQTEVPSTYLEPFKANPNLTEQEKRIFGMIGNLDANVGRVLEALDQSGLADNTIVIFMSDNGLVSRQSSVGRYNAGLRGQKTQIYEGGIRVPFFVRWPQRISSGVTEERGSVMDLVPTLVDLLGRSAAVADKRLDGVSLLPLWQGRVSALADRHIIQQQQPQRSGLTPQPFENAAVVGRRYKLVSPVASAPPELYDLSVDEGERTNLAASHPEVVRELTAAYDAWYQDVTASRGFDPNPAIIGSEASSVFRESMIQVQEKTGLLLTVANAGRYEAELVLIQSELYTQDAEIGLTDGKKVWKQTVNGGENAVKLLLDLPAGQVRLFAWNRGKLARSGYVPWGDDPGFRQIVIKGPLP